MVRPALHVHVHHVSEFRHEFINSRDFIRIAAIRRSLRVLRLEGDLVQIDELL